MSGNVPAAPKKSWEDEFIQSDEVFFELTMENVSEWFMWKGIPPALQSSAFVRKYKTPYM